MGNRDIVERTDATQTATYAHFPIAFVRGEGARLWDADGKEYLDFFSGLAVTSLGHAHPRIVRAIRDQSERVLHVSNVFYNEPASRLGELLVRHSFADRVFFCNSGAEASETAIKTARRYGATRGDGRYEILTAHNSFHGRTIAALTATGQEKFQQGFQPLLPGIRHVPFGDLDAAAAAVRDETIAILVEPIQGEGGVVVPPEGYLKGLRKLCDERMLLLMLDEVQVGMGRTGTLFAYEREGFRPDVMTLAKALGGGLPIGAMLATEEVGSVLTAGSHGSTFGGNPVSCAAAVAVIETLLEDGLLENVRVMGERLRAGLERIRDRIPGVRDVRGRGLILGLELDRPCRPVVAAALERGLVINCAADRVVRLLPPFVVTAADVDRGLGLLEQALAETRS